MVPFLNSNNADKQTLLYHTRDSVRVGELYRYYITYTSPSTPTFTPKYEISEDGKTLGSSDNHVSTKVDDKGANSTPEPSNPTSLWLKIKNQESVALRAAYLAGPYMLYVDLRSEDYSHLEKVYQDSDQPFYSPQIKAGQSEYVELNLTKKKKWKHVWIVDVVSQIIFSPNSEIQFELSIATSKASLKGSNGPQHKKVLPSSCLSVRKLDTLDIWHTPVPKAIPNKPLHLVVLTHGLHSNVGADMLYLKEQIDSLCAKTGENVIVRGYFDNVCKTEKGIAYLGRRLGDYILDTLASGSEDKIVPAKITFIAHSLGGLVQTFAIAHIQSRDPTFFDRIKPQNFICLATPFLGVSNENPGYVKFALDIGFVGKTGRDLGLTWNVNKKLKHEKPLLQILPGGYAHDALKKFRQLTLYANAYNDGIVPLRTASILYLDWKGIVKAGLSMDSSDQDPNDGGAGASDRASVETASEVPNASKAKTSKTSSKSESSSGFPSLVSFVAPQAGYKKRSKIIRRTQTMTNNDSSGDDDTDEHKILKYIPKSTSMLESGMSVLIPPLPSSTFISDPSSRENIILHDKTYREEDLPPRRFKAKSSLFGLTGKKNGTNDSGNDVGSPASSISSISGGKDYPKDKNEDDNTKNISKKDQQVEQSKLEERIAREWHRGLKWRKVLVKLEPDAHNNIVVRRRFANAYGWPVIDHVVRSHFLDSGASQEDLKNKRDHLGSASRPQQRDIRLQSCPDDDDDSFDYGMDLSSMRYSLDRNVASSTHEDDIQPLNKQATNLSADSTMSTESRGSNHRAWESHLARPENEDSEEEGIVFSINTWFDKYRDSAAVNGTGAASKTTADDGVTPVASEKFEGID